MEAVLIIKDNNGKIRNKVVEKETKQKLFEEIYTLYNRGRYTTQKLDIEDNVLNNEFWDWVKALSINDYYKFAGKND